MPPPAKPKLRRSIKHNLREGAETLAMAFWVGVLLLVYAVDMIYRTVSGNASLLTNERIG